MTHENITTKIISKDLLRYILGKITETAQSNSHIDDLIHNQPELMLMNIVWSNLRDIALVCPEILTEADVALLNCDVRRNFNTFLDDMFMRITKSSLPGSMEIGQIALQNNDRPGTIPNYMRMVKIPTAIYNVIQLLLYMHWCVGNTKNILAPFVVRDIKSKKTRTTLLNSHMVAATKKLSTISVVNPELWALIKDLYVTTIQEPRIKWMYDNIYINYSPDFPDTQINVDTIGICIGEYSEPGVLGFASMYCVFKAIIDATLKVHALLGGKSLHVYLGELTQTKGVPTMNASLQALEQLLSHSAVVTDSGEVLNVFISNDGNSVSITPRDLHDTVVQLDERPKITSCKILVNGTEQEIIGVNETDLNEIINSMRRYINDPTAVFTQDQINQLRNTTPVQNIMAEVQQARLDEYLEEHPEVGTVNVQQEQTTVASTNGNTTGNTNEQNVRISPSGERLIARVINGITLWIPESNIQAHQATPTIIAEEQTPDRTAERPTTEVQPNTPGDEFGDPISDEAARVFAELLQDEELMGTAVHAANVEDNAQTMVQTGINAGMQVAAVQPNATTVEAYFDILPDGRRVFRGTGNNVGGEV